MKEMLRHTLTNLSQKPYSRYGETIMEGKSDIPPQGQKSTGPENTQRPESASENPKAKRVISPEERQIIDKAWQEYNVLRASKGEKVSSDELQTQNLIKEKGYMPPLTQEAKELLRKIDDKAFFSQFTSNMLRIFRENGIPEETIEKGDMEEIANALRSNRIPDQNESESSGEQASAGDTGKGSGKNSPAEGQPFRESDNSSEESIRKSNYKGQDIKGNFSDPIIKNFVEELTQEAQRVGGENKLDPHFIENQRQRLRSLLDQQKINAQEAFSLLKNLNARMDEIALERLSGEERQEVNKLRREIDSLPEGNATRGAKIEEMFRLLSPQGSIPSDIVAYALENDEILDSFVARIIAQPLDAETSAYRLSFYGGINMEQLKDILRQAKEHEIGGRALVRRRQYEKVTLSEESATLLHNMNMEVVTGNIKEFIGISQGIQPKHFEFWKSIRGASQVMRAYEQKYDEYLSRYGRITSSNMINLNEEVESYLKYLNKEGLIGNKKLEEWEIDLALPIGRTFFNITMRSAEQVAKGRVPKDIDFKNDPNFKDLTAAEIEEMLNNPTSDMAKEFREKTIKGEISGKERYASFPLESATRMMNWVQYLTYRFEVGKARGGLDFLELVKDHYYEFMKDHGAKLGKNMLTDFNGINVKEMEVGGMFAITGVYSGWRLENQALSQMKITTDKDGTMVIREWFAKYKLERVKAEKMFKEAKGNPGKVRDAQEYLVKTLSPLINSANIGLGVLLKQPAFDGELGYLARKVLWEKIANENTPLMLSYLKGLKFAEGWKPEGDGKIREINEILKIKWGGKTIDSNEWRGLRDKILAQHEFKIKNEIAKMKGEQGLDVPKDLQLTFEEQEVVAAIKTEGAKLAEHLADIAFPYTPFLNDAPFEMFNYNVTGAEYYRRRLASDLPGFYEAEQAYSELMKNPGGWKIEEAFKHLHGIVSGIEGPNGAEDAQNHVFPIFQAFMDWTMTSEGQRQMIFKEIKQSLRKPTSIAQKWAGMEALSMGEFQSRKVLDMAVQQGILNMTLMTEMQKKKKLTVVGLFWALVRDLFWAPFISFPKEFVQKTSQTK